MSVAPCCCTLTPVLPEALTRSLMIATASFISGDGGSCPFWVTARNVAWVPLDKSRPSPTLKSLCQWPGLPMLEPTMPTSISTINTNRAASARPGFEPLFLGGATCPVVPRSIPTEPSRRPLFLGRRALRRDRLVVTVGAGLGPGLVGLAVDGQVVAVAGGGHGRLLVPGAILGNLLA